MEDIFNTPRLHSIFKREIYNYFDQLKPLDTLGTILKKINISFIIHFSRGKSNICLNAFWIYLINYRQQLFPIFSAI